MAETFREILDLFTDRTALAVQWNRKVPNDYKITTGTINMWHHRDSVPAWSWAGLEAAAKDLETPEVTMKRLAAAELEARRQRAASRRPASASPPARKSPREPKQARQ